LYPPTIEVGDIFSSLYKRRENRDNGGYRIDRRLYRRLERRWHKGIRIGSVSIIRILICIRRGQITVTYTAIVAMEALRPATFTIITGLTCRFAIYAVIAIKATIVATATARFRSFGKVEVIIVTRYGVFFGIGLFNMIKIRVGVDYYTGLLKLDVTTPATTGIAGTRLRSAIYMGHSCRWVPIIASRTVRSTLCRAVHFPNPTVRSGT